MWIRGCRSNWRNSTTICSAGSSPRISSRPKRRSSKWQGCSRNCRRRGKRWKRPRPASGQAPTRPNPWRTAPNVWRWNSKEKAGQMPGPHVHSNYFKLQNLFGGDQVEVDDALADFGGIGFVAAGGDFGLNLLELFGGQAGGGLGERGQFNLIRARGSRWRGWHSRRCGRCRTNGRVLTCRLDPHASPVILIVLD